MKRGSIGVSSYPLYYVILDFFPGTVRCKCVKMCLNGEDRIMTYTDDFLTLVTDIFV
jgi:hypothetical protein